MAHDSPLRQVHADFVAREAHAMHSAAEAAGARRPGAAVGQKLYSEVEYLPYGGKSADAARNERPACEIVASFGDVEREYAAIRRSAGLFDSPHRGTLLVEGGPTDRRDFLNRMVTQELKDLVPGIAKQAFWLNRKGRIIADLLVIELGDRMVIDLDVHQAAETVKTLGDFIFAEDVAITDATSSHHHIAVHGRQAAAALATAAGLPEVDLQPLQAKVIAIGEAKVIVVRRDEIGEPGFELIMPRGEAAAVWARLLSTHADDDPDFRGRDFRGRPIGWYAYNIGRIEAGTPLFNIDFGQTNLPHETGILRQRVSFTKGCYLGQEIVARMESLGAPKQILTGLRMEGDHLPVAGAQVFARQSDGAMGPPQGVVTSSTLSPMLGAAPIAFALVKTSTVQTGGQVLVEAEGELASARITDLRFWPAAKLDDSATGAAARSEGNA